MAVEMKRPESGLAPIWNGFPWLANHTAISQATRSILTQLQKYVKRRQGDMMGAIAVPPTHLHMVAYDDSNVVAVSENLIDGESLVLQGIILV
jgi:hypothetical protein